MLWPLKKAPEILKWYREFIVRAPDELNGFFAMLVVPPSPHFPEELHGKTMCGIVWCYCGALEKAERAFAPIRKAQPAALDLVGPIPHPALQGMFDPLFQPGLHWYWKADFFNEITDGAIAEHVKYAENIPTMLSTMHLYPVDGAAGRVPGKATACAYRDAKWAGVIVGVGGAADREQITKWAKEYWESLHPHSAGGVYVNFMMEEGEDRVKATYGANYERLAKVKARYDPENVFHVNQNIKPER